MGDLIPRGARLITPPRTPLMIREGQWWILLCAHCRHPGGAHFSYGCKCGNCSRYVEGGWGVWSHRQADELDDRRGQ